MVPMVDERTMKINITTPAGRLVDTVEVATNATVHQLKVAVLRSSTDCAVSAVSPGDPNRAGCDPPQRLDCRRRVNA